MKHKTYGFKSQKVDTTHLDIQTSPSSWWEGGCVITCNGLSSVGKKLIVRPGLGLQYSP